MGKVIVIASGKGGTGKTTAVGALSSSLASVGCKTLCIDCDIGMRNLDVTLGMSDFTVSDFGDVVSGDKSIADAASAHPKIKNLYFISAPATTAAEDIDEESFRKMMKAIRREYEYCFIDAPAGVGAGFRLAASCADMGIIVTTGDISSMRDGQRAAYLLREAGVTDLRLIVNRVRKKHLKKLKTTIDTAIDAVGVRLLGYVFEDDCVILAANQEIPLIHYKKPGLFSKNKAKKQFNKIAQRILGIDVPI